MSSKARGQNDSDGAFDWPPKQRLVPSEIVKLEKPHEGEPPPASPQMLDSPLLESNSRSPLPLPLPVRLPQSSAPAAVAEAESPGTPTAANAIVQEELPAAVQEELRGVDADFWGPIALDNYLKRSWIMPTAIVVLAVIAVVEGIFLLRARSEQPHVVQQSTPPTSPSVSDTTAPSPAGTTAPPIVSGPAASAVVPQNSGNGAAPADVTNGRLTGPSRQTPATPPARQVPAAAPDPPAPGWVTISAPIELNVSQKGSLLGTTRGPRILLPPGGHVLQLENATFGYLENQWVRIQSGRETTLPITLPEGIVHVNATPWAEISIDGKSVGQTPIGNLKLPIGSHDVVFRHPELGEKTVSALVKVGVATRVSADLTQR